MREARKGMLLVISGPSGAGKGTLYGRVLAADPDMTFSVSYTTRAPRPGEVDGREYFFIDRERYDQMVLQDELLEHAEYVSNGYGTPRFFVEQKLSEGMNVVLDIEIQGARQVREKMPEAVLVFVIPPSMEELRRRLVGRGTDSPEAIEGRLLRAREEYAEADFYDYLIVNDDADEAAADFSAIVRAEHLRAQDRLYLLK